MASLQERTEKATPKHRRRAREKGQVARSADLAGAVVLTAGILTIALTGGRIMEVTAAAFRETASEISDPARATSASGVSSLMHSMLGTLVVAVAPLAAVCLGAALIAGVAQVGLRPAPQALKPDFRRINPITGMRNFLSANLIFEALKAIVKVLVVGAVAALTLLPGLVGLASIVGVSPGALGELSGQKAMEVAERAAFAYVAIGIVDYIWKRRRHERQLRMTKQEVRDEMRQYGVSAEVKAALRRRQMQAARARMMAAVPTADVVVTNPTHYAVALRYDGSRTAPEVVAKGKDLIAAQIRRIAEENDVPVISDPPLARALHQSTEIGSVIPQELYAAVAQVLAFVYRLAGRRRMAS
jgi:flagellar biosynthetic protein FlhB